MRRLRDRLERRGVDGGVSLIELLVASALLLILLPVAGGLLYTGAVAQRDARSATVATTTAQTAAASVQRGVRNAVALRYSRTGTGNADELLVVRTQTGPQDAPVDLCQAWFYNAARGVLYTRSVPVSPSTTAITVPDDAALATWSTLAVRVLPTTGPYLFGVTADQRQVDVDLVVRTGTSRVPTTVSTSVVRRPQQPSGGAPCF